MVYSVSLVIGVVGLVLVILGGALAENLGYPERDPGELIGPRGRTAVAALTGFGMGGLSAEFAPLDFTWPLALLLAAVGAVGAGVWVRYSSWLVRDL